MWITYVLFLLDNFPCYTINCARGQIYVRFILHFKYVKNIFQNRYSVENAYVEEKEGACLALKELSEHVG